jgi:RNA-directed DNA polymerase
VDAFPRHDWLLRAVDKRLREELAKLHVPINEEKSRIVDLGKAELSQLYLNARPLVRGVVG